VVSYWVLVLSDLALPIRLAGALGLVLAVVAVATGIVHDANHGVFFRRQTLNLGLSYSADVLGTSSWLWRIQHNMLHHGNTNVAGFDEDIGLAPLARLAPQQTWHRWHQGQHLYLWPLYGFMGLKNLFVSDVVALATGKMGEQPLRHRVTIAVVVQVAAGKLVHLGWAVVVPLLFNPWWAVLAAYLACSWATGLLLAVTFQLAHCVDRAEFPGPDSARRGPAFASHQLRTTCDIDSPMPVAGRIYRWLVGGLDHQIEHHLAPRLPHTVYPALARRFRRQCQLNGITYRVHPGVWAALCSHGRWLRAMGRAPVGSGHL